MEILFIMDPLEKVKAYKDTTYFMMLAAQELGHQVYYLNHRDLIVKQGGVFAPLLAVRVNTDIDQPFTPIEERFMPLSEMAAVFVRTDPPFDRNYFYTTLLLDLLPPTTKIINRPSGLRNWNEKLAALFYPHLTPKTLVTQKADLIKQFLEMHGKITLKPIDGYAGKGILFLESGNANIEQLIGESTHDGRHRVIAQEYLPAAKDGDKRILLLNGEPLGGILRLHAEGVELNNLDAGGTAHPTELTDREREICQAVKSGLLEQGVYFAGIDVIGGMLIEVNVTSPTGLQELCRFSGEDFHHQIIKATIEQNGKGSI